MSYQHREPREPQYAQPPASIRSVRAAPGVRGPLRPRPMATRNRPTAPRRPRVTALPSAHGMSPPQRYSHLSMQRCELSPVYSFWWRRFA